MNNKHIKNKIGFYRNTAGFSEKDVALKMGFSDATRISRWEKGETIPRLRTLFKLCAVLQVRLEQLYPHLFKTIRIKRLSLKRSRPGSGIKASGK